MRYAMVLAVLSVVALGACGAADENEEFYDGDEVGVIQQDLTVWLNCNAPNGYPNFVGSTNVCGLREFSCVFTNATYSKQKTVTVSYPVAATSCCPAGHCPNQQCYNQTSAATLVCTLP